jgi:vancomycin permeability regulator SanA
MLRAMETNTRDHRATPNSTSSNQTSDDAPASGWPGSRKKRSRYENPSLDRYTDLRFEESPTGHRRWVIVLASVLLAMVLGVLGLMAAIYIQARNDEARPVDAIVVMGAAQYNGRPSEVLSARLDHALDLYNQGYAPLIIVTGGNLPGDVYTEAEVGEQYLLDRGVPQQAILKENEGNDTWDSMRGVAEVAKGRDINSVLIVSDGFHLFRSERMANKVGFDSYASAAPDSPIRPGSGNEFSYVIRETGAVIVQMPDWLF